MSIDKAIEDFLSSLLGPPRDDPGTLEELGRLRLELVSEENFAREALKNSSTNEETMRLYVIYLACESLTGCHVSCATSQLQAIRFMLHGDSNIKSGDVS